MLLSIEHRLLFEYDAYISESFMELRVEPRSASDQTLRSFFLAVGPSSKVTRYTDWNCNAVHHFGVTDFHDRIEVLTRSVVDTHPPGAPPESVAGSAPRPEELGSLVEFAAFGGPVLRSRSLERLAAELSAPAAAPLGEQVRAIGSLLLERFQYRRDVTSYRSSSDHMLEEGAGVCQDFAHVALGLLRLRGIPCRYVSGYLHVGPRDAEPAQSHAWIEVASREGPWLAFDPTHDQAPDARYISVARGRHYDDVPPNLGIFRGNARETLRAEVHTAEVSESGVASLHRELGRIDLPVFREIPGPARHPAGEERASGVEEQQQQQQQ